MEGIINKYSQASKFLSGVGLNPDTHPETGYPPFNDTPIIQYFLNRTLSNAAQDGSPDASPNNTSPSTNSSIGADPHPILGLPRANYTDVHIMPMKDDIDSGLDVSYYGPLLFGTPSQELTVSVDTGSADLWIPAVCPSCSNTQFAPGASSTYHNSNKKISLVYVSGRIASLSWVHPCLIIIAMF